MMEEKKKKREKLIKPERCEHCASTRGDPDLTIWNGNYGKAAAERGSRVYRAGKPFFCAALYEHADGPERARILCAAFVEHFARAPAVSLVYLRWAGRAADDVFVRLRMVFVVTASYWSWVSRGWGNGWWNSLWENEPGIPDNTVVFYEIIHWKLMENSNV